MLHKEKEKPSKAKSVIVKSKANDTSNKYCLLTTAIIGIKAGNGKVVRARALLDNGSQVHLITKELRKSLTLVQPKSHLLLKALGKIKPM